MSDSIYAKLVEIQRELRAPKDQYNSFNKFNYRSAEGIIEAVKPLLHERGLVLVINDELVQVGERYYIKATASIFDSADNYIYAKAYAREPDSKKGYDEAQITGASSSYARKYALNGLFAIDDNRDADTDEHTQQRTLATTDSRGPDLHHAVDDHSDDPAWQLNYDDLADAIEAKVPDIDGEAVINEMARIKGAVDPKHLDAKTLGGMIEFARSDKFIPYYTETIAPALAANRKEYA